MARLDTSLISQGTLVPSVQYYTSLTDRLTGDVSVNIDSACANLTVTDSSNFDVEKAHFRIDHFTTWRRFTITNPDGTTTTYSSIEFGSTASTGSQIAEDIGTYHINEADETIINPDGGLDFTVPLTGGDGIYNLKLCQVPVWTLGQSYNEYGGLPGVQDIVVTVSSVTITGETWILYSFYRCIQTHGAIDANKPTGSGNQYWERINVDDLTLEDGYEKYCDEESVLIHCELDQCISILSSNILCGDKKIDFCSSDPCCCYDEEYMALLKLYSLRHAMDIIYAYGDYTYIKEIVTLSNRICGCHDTDNVVTDAPDHTCLDKWVQGGPATGQNDQGAPGSSITTGEGTTITDPSAFFVTAVMLGTGDVIKMPSGQIWTMIAPGGANNCSQGCYNPETSIGQESGHWELCN